MQTAKSPGEKGRIRRIRFPLLASGMFALLLAMGAALVRLGWEVPLPNYDMLVAHGPLMVCGFLGTLIGLERAVGLGRPWAYAAPALSGLGGVHLVFRPDAPEGALLIALGSLVLAFVFVPLLRRRPALFTACVAAGALLYLAGNLLWLGGWPVYAVVPWWAGFLLLTIAGERLELSRLLRPGPKVRAAFVAAAGLYVAGALLTAAGFATERTSGIRATAAGDLFASGLFGLGARLAGLGMLGLGIWLFVYDLARRSLRQPGLPRFIAVCMLTGYGWLCFAGLAGLRFGGVVGGLAYDAGLHAFFLGFVFAMIFGHAPIIFPGVLGLAVPFRAMFYIHLALLHLTLALRVAGDLSGWLPGRKWGGLLNAVSILAFLGNTALAVLLGRIRPKASGSNRKTP